MHRNIDDDSCLQCMRVCVCVYFLLFILPSVHCNASDGKIQQTLQMWITNDKSNHKHCIYHNFVCTMRMHTIG